MIQDTQCVILVLSWFIDKTSCFYPFIRDAYNAICNVPADQQTSSEKSVEFVHRVSTVTFSPNNFAKNGVDAVAPIGNINIRFFTQNFYASNKVKSNW